MNHAPAVTFKEVIKAIIENNNAVVDDHRTLNGANVKTELWGVGKFVKDGFEYVVALYERGTFCLNQVRIKSDGFPHLTTVSVGGVVKQLVLSDLSMNYVGTGALIEVHIF
jgi:hypothetical protein